MVKQEMDMKRIDEIVFYLKEKISYVPDVLVILGSGLGSMAEHVENQTIVKYEEIPNFLVSTVEGHAGQFVFGEYRGKKVAMMQGRFHYYEGYSMKEVTLPVFVMRRLGVQNMIVTNACGGVNLQGTIHSWVETLKSLDLDFPICPECTTETSWLLRRRSVKRRILL
jgi:purine-nucleoside phosphorylase